eukprot:1397737-Amphidinium_carterae.1
MDSRGTALQKFGAAAKCGTLVFLQVVRAEQMTYWRGNMFVGHDKTYIESLFGKTDLFNDNRTA